MTNNKDINILKESVYGIIRPDSKIVEGDFDLSIGVEFNDTFPKLSRLIKKARVTSVDIDSDSYILFAWDNIEDQICGWLNKIEEPESYKCQIIEEHELLLRYIGGIKETFNEPEESFTNNQMFLFLGSECMRGIGDWDDYYSMMCEDYNLEEIDYSNYISFINEANGALTMYEPSSKHVLLFSHDHCFDNVEPLENQPEYTFHKFKGLTTFTDYVEELANQWLKWVK